MSPQQPQEFGDYLVFVDESGDHSLTRINPQHPVFVLAFVIIRKSDYIGTLCPALQHFKMRYWGHDEVVLHEHEIRKPQDAFSFLLRRPVRERFLEELTALMEAMPATIVAVLIDKPAFAAGPDDPATGVYDHAMKIGIDAVFRFLIEAGQAEQRTPVIVECRGRKEDRELELAFRRHCDVGGTHARPLPFDLVMVPKTSNSAGLQIADLVARPIGIAHLRPHQANRAFDIIRTRFYLSPVGEADGWGFHSIP